MCAELGVFGETPLHQAVLFARTDPDEDYRIVKGLWRDYPDLRTAQYEKPLHRGENVLHIALVRKLPKDLINFFLEESDQIARTARARMHESHNPLRAARQELHGGMRGSGS